MKVKDEGERVETNLSSFETNPLQMSGYEM
jgi:hypothetical protein